MSVLKTFVIALFLAPSTLQAMETDLVALFSSCTGRYSAEMEHAWLIGDERSDQLEHRRDQFASLILAVTPKEQRRESLNLRISAKLAHASLLTQARFSQDRDRARWALRRAEGEIAYCSSLLLDS